MKIRTALLLSALGLPACQNMPEPFAPPLQRQQLADYRGHPSAIVTMSAPGARNRFVQDISDQLDISWRWTGQRPTVKVRVDPSDTLRFVIDLALPEVTFKDTGPVTIAFFVGDHLVDRVRYITSGTHHFEKPVPAAWINEAGETLVGAEIDKMWVSKEDGTRLGFILTEIGLAK